MKFPFYFLFEFITFWIQGVLERLEWKYTMVAKSILSCFSTCLDWAFFSFRHIQTCFIWCANKFYTSCISTNFCQIGHRQIQERHPDISFWNFPTTSQVLISPSPSDLPAFSNKSYKKQKRLNKIIKISVAFCTLFQSVVLWINYVFFCDYWMLLVMPSLIRLKHRWNDHLLGITFDAKLEIHLVKNSL